MEEEVFEGRQESAEQMRRGITWTSFTKVAMNTGTVNAVARRELDAISGKFGEADCAIQTAEAGACALVSALAVPSAGNTLPSETHLVGSALVRFSSNVPCTTGKPSLATPAKAALSHSLANLHVSFSLQHLTTTCIYPASFSGCLPPS